MNELALFAGGGGILGGVLLGWRCVCAVEIDDYCRRILAQRQIDGLLLPFPIWDDITTFSGEVLRVLLAFQVEELCMAGKLKKLSEEQVQEAARLYEAGMSVADITHLVGTTRQSLWDVLRRRGVQMRPGLRYGTDNHFFRNGARADNYAQNVAEKAIERGELVNPGQCGQCGGTGAFTDGRTAIQAHHDDYNEPLRVRWLCQPCHHAWHKHHQPVQRRGGPEPAEIDVISGGFP